MKNVWKMCSNHSFCFFDTNQCLFLLISLAVMKELGHCQGLT